jgi:hypothetical protein
MLPASARRPVTPADLAGHTPREIALMRNEIYARHGRPFRLAPIRAYFDAQPWYHASATYRDSLLSPLEKRNAEFIFDYENRHGMHWPE